MIDNKTLHAQCWSTNVLKLSSSVLKSVRD